MVGVRNRQGGSAKDEARLAAGLDVKHVRALRGLLERVRRRVLPKKRRTRRPPPSPYDKTTGTVDTGFESRKDQD